MVTTQRLLTYDDLQQIPDDRNRYEVIGGELVVSPLPIGAHQLVLGHLLWLLGSFLRKTGRGEVIAAPHYVTLGVHDVVEPDLIVVAKEHGRISRDRNYFVGPPTLVVEVISPSSRKRDRSDKQSLYARSGICEYWIVDPQHRTIEILILEGESYHAVIPAADGRMVSRVVPDLIVDPVEVFANLD